LIEEHSMVQATRNLSNKKPRGCKGMAVFIYDDPKLAYEVESVDNEAATIELLTVTPSGVKEMLKR